MNDTLTKEDLELILSYFLVYDDLNAKEEVFHNFRSYKMKLEYIKAHSDYEAALGGIMQHFTPMDLMDKLSQIRKLSKEIEQDIANNFNLQSSEE